MDNFSNTHEDDTSKAIALVKDVISDSVVCTKKDFAGFSASQTTISADNNTIIKAFTYHGSLNPFTIIDIYDNSSLVKECHDWAEFKTALKNHKEGLYS